MACGLGTFLPDWLRLTIRLAVCSARRRASESAPNPVATIDSRFAYSREARLVGLRESRTPAVGRRANRLVGNSADKQEWGDAMKDAIPLKASFST